MLKLGDIVFGITADASGLDKAMAKMAQMGVALDGLAKKDNAASQARARALLAQEKAMTSALMSLKNSKFKMGMAGAPDELLKRADEAAMQLQKRFSAMKGPLDPVQMQRASTEFKVAMQQIGHEFDAFKKKSADAAKVAKMGLGDADKSAAKLERQMGSLRRAVEGANQKLEKIGSPAARAGINANNQALAEYTKVTYNTESTVLDLIKAENKLRDSLIATAGAAQSSGLNQTQRQAENLKDALLNARLQLEKFKIAASKKGASADTMGNADAAYGDLEAAFQRFGKDSTQGREAARTFKQAITGAFADTGQEQRINRWSVAMRNLNSAVTLVVGPLSGVGSRVSALTATFLRADVAAGILITGFVAAAAATAALGVISVKTELEVGRLTARFEALERIGGGKTADTFRELAMLADRAGTKFITTAEGFSRLEAAAAGTSLEGEKIRKVFEDITVGAARFQLDNDQLAGTLKALEQMLSKGTVQAEELRGQLGDRLPGAFAIASRAMGVTTKDLNKMLKSGEVIASDFLPKFAAEFARSFGTDGRVDTLQADLNRLSNSFLLLRNNFNETFGVSDTFRKVIQATSVTIDKLASNLDKVAAGAAAFAAVVGTALAGAFVAVKWAAILSALGKMYGLFMAAAKGGWALATAMYGAVMATNSLTAAQARLDAVVSKTPWGLIAKIVAVVGASLIAGVVAWNNTSKAMSAAGREARRVRDHVAEVNEEFARFRELRPDAKAEELAFMSDSAMTDVEEVNKTIESLSASIAEQEAMLTTLGSQYEKTFTKFSNATGEGALSAYGGELARIESRLKGAQKKIEEYNFSLENQRAKLLQLTAAERDRQQTIEETGSLLSRNAQRDLGILQQQARAMYASESAYASFNAQVAQSDGMYDMIKEAGEAMGLTESQIRAVGDAFAGIENKVEPQIIEEFAKRADDTRLKLKDIPGELDKIFEGLKKLKSGDLSVFQQMTDFVKNATGYADPFVVKLRELFKGVEEVDQALRDMNAANRKNIMREMGRDVARAAADFELIGKSDLTKRFAANQKGAEDAARGFEKQLAGTAMGAAAAKEASMELYDALVLLGEAQIKFDASKEIEQFTYDLMQLQKQTSAALSSDFALQEFDRIAYVDDQVRRLALTFKDLYETEEEANAATAMWAKALRENADALYARQMAQTRWDADMEIERMYALANATIEGSVAVDKLNKKFAAYDAVKSYADSIRGLPMEEFEERLLKFASAFDVTANLERSTGGLLEWSTALQDYGLGALDAFTAAFADMISEFDFSSDAIKKAAQSLARDLTMTWLNLSLTNPLKNALFGQDMQTMAGQGATALFGGGLGGLNPTMFGLGKNNTVGNDATSAAQQQLAMSMQALELSASSAATTLGTDLVNSSAQAALQAGTAAAAAGSEVAMATATATSMTAMQIAITATTSALTQLALASQLAASSQAGSSVSSLLPGVSFAAKGTVLGGPTYFPNFNTVGGEAGPEGLLPLSRMADGKLGVAMRGGGGGGNQTHNTYQFGDIIIPPGASPRAVKKSITQSMQDVERSRRVVAGNVK